MTVTEFAFAAGHQCKRIPCPQCRKRQWLVNCLAHGDKSPSLSIGVGKTRPIGFHCMSQGCSADSILRAMGLTWSSILGGGEMTTEIRQRLRTQDRLKKVELYLGAFLINKVALDTENRDYWARQEMRAEDEICRLKKKLGRP